MKTKAAILETLCAPLVVDEIEIPALTCGQVLVQIHRSGICGAQLNEIGGVKGPDKFLPHVLGHEGGGVVMEVGPGVTQVKAGDHVVLHWCKGAGIHAQTPKYKWGSRMVNSGWVTTFQEYAVISENRLTPIAKDVKFEVAALLGCAVTTALGAINNDARVRIGESVAIYGIGGVGLNLLQGAAMVAANPIIAIDINPFKLEMAHTFGATHVLDGRADDIEDQIRKIVGPSGVDVIFETTGNTRLIERAYKLSGPQGRTICIGVPRHDQDITIHSLPLHHGKVITGVEGGHTYPTADIPRYINLYKNGKLELDALITHRFPLEQINQALDEVRGGNVGRCILEMTT